jgi:hypothetical protein
MPSSSPRNALWVSTCIQLVLGVFGSHRSTPSTARPRLYSSVVPCYVSNPFSQAMRSPLPCQFYASPLPICSLKQVALGSILLNPGCGYHGREGKDHGEDVA